MSIIDWIILVSVMSVLMVLVLFCGRLTKSVADFLAANRCAGRYLLTVSDGAAGVGAITIMAHFEKFYEAGFGGAWWGSMMAPLLMILSLSGWVIYRFRATRALTIAEFFEMRYGRRFRIFAGFTAFLSGVLNYGIFPAVTARFLIYYARVPEYVWDIGQPGGFQVNVTLGLVMAVMLGLSAWAAMRGGQVTIMLTDWVQGQFMVIVFILVLAILLFTFSWSEIIQTLQVRSVEGKSLLNPLDQSKLPDFSPGFFLMQAFILVYGYRAWQGTQGYNAAAKSPHEAKMAGILNTWRAGMMYMLVMLVPICVYVVLHNPRYVDLAQATDASLGPISGNPFLQDRLRVPVTIAHMLPVGVVGLFAAAMVTAAFSTDNTYLHSWGSIFIQDVVLPLRKKSLTPRQHMRWLRSAIVGVAVFVWFFSMLFPLRDHLYMFQSITGAIFIGGAGSAIIGGLYWRRATPAGAFTGMATGSVLAVAGLVTRNLFWPWLVTWQVEPDAPAWIMRLPKEFPLNGMTMSFGAAFIAATLFVLVSLVTKPLPDGDLDRVLSPGDQDPKATNTRAIGPTRRRWRRLRWIGINEHFTRSDVFIYLFKVAWTFLWFGAFLIGTTYGLLSTRGVPEGWWPRWWAFQISLSIIVGIGTAVWFFVGGIYDLKYLIYSLRTNIRDESDDGQHRAPAAKDTPIGDEK